MDTWQVTWKVTGVAGVVDVEAEARTGTVAFPISITIIQYLFYVDLSDAEDDKYETATVKPGFYKL